MNVYIIVEIKVRDFLPRLLTGAEAALNGNDVYLGDKEITGYISQNKLNPGIIYLKSITPYKKKIAQLKLFKKKNFIVTTLDEEGGISWPNFNYFANKRYSNKTLSYADAIFCYGDYDFKNYIKIFPKFKKKFLLTGNPRFDLLNNKIANNLENEKKKDLKKKKIVLISTYFLIAFKMHSSEYLSIEDEFRDDYWYDIFEKKNAFSVSYLKLIKKIINNFPDIEIEIWTHPMESIDNWKKILPKNKNIKFVKGFKVLSKKNPDNRIFIHNGSMLALSAILQGKIVISYQPIVSKWNNISPNVNSIVMKSDDEIINFIKNKKFYKIKPNKKKLSNLNKIISNSKSYDASFKVASHWEKFKSEKLSIKNNLSVIKFRHKLKFIKQKLSSKIYNIKFEPITKNELSKLKDILCIANPNFKQLKFSLIGPRLVNIKKKEYN